MAKRLVPKRPGRLFIQEHLTHLRWNQGELASRLDVTPAAVSRWIKGKANGGRDPDNPTINAIEQVMGLKPGELSRPPQDASRDTLLAGMSEQDQLAVMSFISFIKNRDGQK